VRKIIVLDLGTIDPGKLLALAAANLALGVVYWLVRDQVRKDRGQVRRQQVGIRRGIDA
jgi:uncharacterized membrane protein (DUF373 family)